MHLCCHLSFIRAFVLKRFQRSCLEGKRTNGKHPQTHISQTSDFLFSPPLEEKGRKLDTKRGKLPDQHSHKMASKAKLLASSREPATKAAAKPVPVVAGKLVMKGKDTPVVPPAAAAKKAPAKAVAPPAAAAPAKKAAVATLATKPAATPPAKAKPAAKPLAAVTPPLAKPVKAAAKANGATPVAATTPAKKAPAPAAKPTSKQSKIPTKSAKTASLIDPESGEEDASRVEVNEAEYNEAQKAAKSGKDEKEDAEDEPKDAAKDAAKSERKRKRIRDEEDEEQAEITRTVIKAKKEIKENAKKAVKEVATEVAAASDAEPMDEDDVEPVDPEEALRAQGIMDDGSDAPDQEDAGEQDGGDVSAEAEKMAKSLMTDLLDDVGPALGKLLLPTSFCNDELEAFVTQMTLFAFTLRSKRKLKLPPETVEMLQPGTLSPDLFAQAVQAADRISKHKSDRKDVDQNATQQPASTPAANQAANQASNPAATPTANPTPVTNPIDLDSLHGKKSVTAAPAAPVKPALVPGPGPQPKALATTPERKTSKTLAPIIANKPPVPKPLASPKSAAAKPTVLVPPPILPTEDDDASAKADDGEGDEEQAKEDPKPTTPATNGEPGEQEEAKDDEAADATAEATGEVADVAADATSDPEARKTDEAEEAPAEAGDGYGQVWE